MTLVWKTKVPSPNEPEPELSGYMKALGHPVRLRLVRTLMQRGPLACGDLVAELNLAQSTVSEHLRILKTHGLVDMRAEGLRRVYAARRDTLTRLRALVQSLNP